MNSSYKSPFDLNTSKPYINRKFSLTSKNFILSNTRLEILYNLSNLSNLWIPINCEGTNKFIFIGRRCYPTFQMNYVECEYNVHEDE